MNLSAVILHYSRIERQQIADIARWLIRNVRDLRSAHIAHLGRLRWINPWARCDHVHLLAHDLLMREGKLDRQLLWIDLRHLRAIETLLLHVDCVGRVTVNAVLATAGVVRSQSLRWKTCLGDHHLGLRDSDSIFVVYGDFDLAALRKGRPHAANENAEESDPTCRTGARHTHSVGLACLFFGSPR